MLVTFSSSLLVSVTDKLVFLFKKFVALCNDFLAVSEVDLIADVTCPFTEISCDLVLLMMALVCLGAPVDTQFNEFDRLGFGWFSLIGFGDGDDLISCFG